MYGWERGAGVSNASKKKKKAFNWQNTVNPKRKVDKYNVTNDLII